MVGNSVLFRAHGSAFPRAMPGACLSTWPCTVIAAMVSVLCDTASWDVFQNTYPLQLFTFSVGFMVVFRNNLSYGRYWEGRTKLQQMTARLSDAARAADNFDRPSPEITPTAEQMEEHMWFCDTLVHLVSLFHGIALATLRGDFDMENITVRCRVAVPEGRWHLDAV